MSNKDLHNKNLQKYKKIQAINCGISFFTIIKKKIHGCSFLLFLTCSVAVFAPLLQVSRQGFTRTTSSLFLAVSPHLFFTPNRINTTQRVALKNHIYKCIKIYLKNWENRNKTHKPINTSSKVRNMVYCTVLQYYNL